ncbi:MAG: hypothetical protein K0Q48_3356 [Bacillota bacterium]|nr:hypothetical protein [Bacillota bacterium]
MKEWLFVKEKKGVKIKQPADRLPAAVISKLELKQSAVRGASASPIARDLQTNYERSDVNEKPDKAYDD